jgi:invasion protein IalB
MRRFLLGRRIDRHVNAIVTGRDPMNITALFRIFAALCVIAAFSVSASAQQKKTGNPTDQAVLLGQFGEWGAYRAMPGGKKICFALAKPTSTTSAPTGRSRDPSYAFVSTRPTEKVKNEVSVIVGYAQKPGQDASAAVGSATYPMYTQNDGAWVKNAAEEAQMVETMRKGSDLIVKSESARGTKTTDTYSLKGIGQALDKVAEECK